MAKSTPEQHEHHTITTVSVPRADVAGIGMTEQKTSACLNNVAAAAADTNMEGATPTSTTDLDVEQAARPRIRLLAILAALFLSLFVAALDATIVATAIPTIASELHSGTGYTWIGGAYLLGNAASGPIWARFSDIWGRKPILLLAVAVFSCSSIICALAVDMSMLVAGRAIQGTAGGGLMLLVNIVVSDLFSVRNRSLYLGLLEFVWAFAAGVGPVLGGAFTEYASWRWCWWINLPIQGVTFGLLVLFLDVHNPRTGVMDGIKAIDWFGSISILGLVLMLLLGLDFGGETFPWNSPTVICLIVFGALMSLFFIYSEKRLAKYPLMPLSIFSHRSNIAALLVCTIHGFVFIAAEYYLPLYFQAVHSTTPILSGVLILPVAVTTALTGISVGFIIHRSGRYLECMWVGTALLTLGNGLFIYFDATTPLATIIGFMIVEGIGAGLLFEPPLIAIQSMVSQDDTATATSTFAFVRSIGTSLSVVIGGVVFQNSMSLRTPFLQAAGLSTELLEKFSGKDAAANVLLIRTIADPAQQMAVKEAFAWSMRNIWITVTCAGAFGFLTSFFVGKQHLKQEHTETVTGLLKEKVSADIELT